ncbi:pseudouridine synthase [Pontibacter sp. SGAir0037]|uniref:pseudouridine synthase n=1 Tax=Pontibacter sp. SGAir0037 TaxID=2571030 RepID=UPI0010CD04B8|nr:pseudouridine synthase [Pontibacter sp. SGAir0037]QCR22033.1 hypothetical protein C1N53_06570 [Pontibacter sp. SGAir0037]
MEPKRLNKYISDAGFCSRREADELLEQGRVTVNGKIPQPGTMVTAKDKVRIDDQILSVREEEPVFLALNKPAGIATSADRSVRNNIISAINHPASLQPIGLMDRDAEGLIFLSNDKDLVNRMTKGDYKYEKEYIVTVDKVITPAFLEKMSEVSGPAEFSEESKKNHISRLDPTRFKIVLEPGTNHHVKRLVEAQGYKLVKLKRTRIQNLTISQLATGHWRTLTPVEVDELKKVLSSKVAGRKPFGASRSGSSAGRGTNTFNGKRSESAPARPGRPAGAAAKRKTSKTTGGPTKRGTRGSSRTTTKGSVGRGNASRKSR